MRRFIYRPTFTSFFFCKRKKILKTPSTTKKKRKKKSENYHAHVLICAAATDSLSCPDIWSSAAMRLVAGAAAPRLVLSSTRSSPPRHPQAIAAISSLAGVPPLASPLLGRNWLVHQNAGSPASTIDSRVWCTYIYTKFIYVVYKFYIRCTHMKLYTYINKLCVLID